MLIENVANKRNEVAELDLVFINEKEVMTDSLIVAEAFGKAHSKVLRDIRDLVSEIEGFGGQANFGQSSYVNLQGREMPKYTMDKDAFLMLVMGYRGDKAVEIRYRYIQAFNAMYAYIQDIAKSKQEKHFDIVRALTTAEEKVSWAGREMRKWQDDGPVLRKAVEDSLKDMQESIDYVFTDNKQLEH